MLKELSVALQLNLIAHPETGEILIEAGERIDRRKAEEIQAAGINSVLIKTKEGHVLKVLANDQPGRRYKNHY